MSTQPVVLIDLSAEFWRNFHGTGSALGGYELTLERVEWYAKEYPGTVIVCCDSPVNKRKAINPEYKAQRKPRPPEGIESIRAAQARLSTWLPVVQREGFEADDVIATLVDQAWPREVLILGSEKDFYALISDSVQLIGKNGPIGIESCEKKFGVKPGQMTEFLALTGDASDNVKGCEGIGIMKAQAILQEYGSIGAAIRAAQDGSMKIKGIGETLLANLAAFDPEPALQMVRLMRDVPVSLDALLNPSAPRLSPETFPDFDDVPF